MCRLLTLCANRTLCAKPFAETNARIESKAMENSSQLFDVCIICALPEEARAFLEVVRTQYEDAIEERNSSRYHYSYRFATIKNNKDETLNLHISWLPHYGPQEMTLHLSRILEECQPRIAIMIGICAGDAQHVQLGDLVVAERTFTYDNGKFTLDERGQSVHEHDTMTYQLDANILQFLRLFDDWKPLIVRLKRPPSPSEIRPKRREVRCHVKSMASGNAVRADNPFRDVRAPVHGTVAIDMEGAAFGLVMSRHPLIPWLVVKGVCDYADRDKNDAYHDYAARASALYALSFIRTYVTNERLPRLYGPSPSSRAGPSVILSVPYRRNPLFTGREKLLEFIQKKLTKKRAAALTQAQAINGLGGIGKTQVAVEYAYRYQDEYQAVLWVTAATRETIITDFVKVAALLHLSERYGANPRVVVAAVKEWLISHTNWLLILDNVDDLELVHEFLPTEIKGYVLLTTRIQATGAVATAIPVDKMSSAEGILLLLKRAKLLSADTPTSRLDRAIARAIVEELDGLPLALDQAGAYVEETSCSLSDYLALYRQRRMALLSRRSCSSLDYPHTVASTWSLSFQQVEQADPAAADLLRLCAFLDPDAIPETIVTEGAKELGPMLGPVAADPLLLNEAIRVLRRYSLVKRDPEEKILNLHRLVQVVLKDGLSEAVQKQWAERAVRAVNAVFPEVTHETSTLAQRYLSQVEICAGLIEQYHLWFPQAARLLHQAGWHLRGSAQYAQSEHLLQLSLTIYKQTVGTEDPDVADNLNHLALLYHSQGRFSEAEPLYQEAHAIREKVLGPEHFETAKGLNNMGEFYRAQGRYSEAEPLYQRSLAIREKVLGPDARQTAIVIHNLARNSYAQGQYAKAEALYQRAQRIYEKTLKPEDPEIAAVLDHLARVYYAQGGYDKAESLMQHAITIRQEVLGSRHPHFAQSLCGLAKIYCAQGRYAEAEPPMQEALAICEIMHGPKHHSTLLMMENLAELYRLQGRFSEAEPMYPRIREIYGSLSLSAMIALKEHEPLYQQVLAAYEKVPGPDDPAIATVLETYAARLQQAGRMQEAAIFDTRAKAIHAKSVV